MNDSPSAPHESVHPTLDQRVVEEFRQAWHDERRPAIEEYLPRAPIDERPALFRELLAIELRFRSEHGETPNPDDYRTRFSDYADTVAEVFSGHTPSLDFDVHLSVTTDSQSAAQLTANHDQPAAARSFESDRVLPSSFGRYAVITRLGGGGFGNVYLAFDPQLNRKVAIKVPRAERFSKPGSREQFLHEARTAAALDHPGIVKVHDVGQGDNGAPYVVFEFIEGKSLDSLLREGRPTFERTAELIAQVAEAVHYAHKKGIVHRDLKPANVLLDTAGKPKIADFGLAYHDADWRSRIGDISGTAPYMSPEQIEGRTNDIDGRTDIWSLGVILYQMLTGRWPFSGSGRQQIFDEIQKRAPKPLRQIDELIPKVFESICSRCLQKRVADRYSCCADVEDELRSWLGPSAPARRTPRRFGRRALLGGATMALTGAAWGGYALFIAEPPLLLPDFNNWQEILYRRKPQVIWARDPRCSQFIWRNRRFWETADQPLRVESCQTYVLRLAEIQQDSLQLQVGIQQLDWQGSTGVFFGHSDFAGADGTTEHNFQSLEVVRSKAHNVFAIEWCLWKLTQDPDGQKHHVRMAVWSAPIPGLFGDKDEHLLGVSALNDQLAQVTWDGQVLPQLTSNNNHFGLATPVAGSIGVLNYSGVTFFRSVRIKVSGN